MKSLFIIFLLGMSLFLINSCNSMSRDAVLKQCKTLGDESIIYARANYVKLFHSINPDKFSDSYKQIKDFDNVTHRNVIETYDMAVSRLKTNDPVSNNFLKACKDLARFSKNLVDHAYPKALSFKKQSKLEPLTDEFFLEINKIVKFDHTIGKYKKNFVSFKQQVTNYKKALKEYLDKYQSELSQQN